MNELIKTARNAVSKKPRGARFFIAGSAAKFWKHHISSASERAFHFGIGSQASVGAAVDEERWAGKTHLPASWVLAQSEQFEAWNSVDCKWGIPRAVYLIFYVILPVSCTSVRNETYNSRCTTASWRLSGGTLCLQVTACAFVITIASRWFWPSPERAKGPIQMYDRSWLCVVNFVFNYILSQVGTFQVPQHHEIIPESILGCDQ